MKLPKVITHKNLPEVEEAIRADIDAVSDPDHWAQQPVYLEFPAGEIAEDWLKTLALVGMGKNYECLPLTGKEGFRAQGLEGKIRVRKPLINAVYNLRDLLPRYRGRIITREGRDGCNQGDDRSSERG